SLVGGCWVGADDRDIHFDAMSEGQGAAMALPIMGLFMKKVYGDSALGYSESEVFEISETYSNPCKTFMDEDTEEPTRTQVMDEFFN
ncbi:penicillin-binding protein, partial [Bacteroidales bacterium OttesenSCG-928-A17]|nr:penicillin-binding protein [Bacteroidales bacterium OttesenSCG-928-A17]